MANIGTATLTITPKLSGLKQAVDSQLKGVDTQASQELGENIDKNISGGFAKAGIAAGVFATVTSKVMDTVSSHIGSAISRFDTLNNYPTVMENLGYSSEQAQASITKISDRLQTLPTTLDSMVSVVQGLTATVNDLDKATDVGLALNDMLLAAGASTEQVSGAMEQFRRIIAQGKPDMQSWQSITIAMPGQMKQLAEAMLGAGHNADELYTALGGGGAKATISLDELMQKMIEMDTTSTDTFHSFQEQAETAAGGVQTSMENMGNAVTRGITSVMDTIGKENIAGVFNTIKGVINDTFKGLNDVLVGVMPTILNIGGMIKDNLPTIMGLAKAFIEVKVAMLGIKAIGGVFSDVIGGIKNAGSTISGIGEAFRVARQTSLASSAGVLRFSKVLIAAGSDTKTFSAKLTELGGNSVGVLGKMKAFGSGIKGVFSSLASNGVIVGAVTAGITLLVSAINDASEKQKTFVKATDGLKTAVANSTSLSTIGERYKRVSDAAIKSANSVEENAEAMCKVVDSINERAKEAEETINLYQKAQDIIDEYAGTSLESIKSDATAYGDVSWAIDFLNEKLGTNIELQDVANGKYKDANGKVQDLKTSINELVEAKKQEARANAYNNDLQDLANQEYEAKKTYDAALEEYNKEVERANNSQPYKIKSKDMNGNDVEYWVNPSQGILKDAEEKLKPAKEAYEAARQAVEDLSNAYGKNELAEEQHAANVAKMSAWMYKSTKEAFTQSGHSSEEFIACLESLGLKVSDLSSLSQTQFDNLIRNFDGSAQSLSAGLTDIIATSGEFIGIWRDRFSEMGVSFDDTARKFNISVEELSTHFTNAGIKAEDMKNISSSAFEQMVGAVNGDIDKLCYLIGVYNSSEMDEKRSEINTADAEKQLDWISEKLKDYDNLNPDEKYEKVHVEGQTELDNILKTLDNFKNEPDKTTKYVDLVTSYIQNGSQNAAGGIRTHADGAIVNNPGRGIPLDIVGEDGAEAIVPLTNTKYAMPFVKMIAQEVAKVMLEQSSKPTQNFTINANDPNLVATVVAQKQRLAFS